MKKTSRKNLIYALLGVIAIILIGVLWMLKSGSVQIEKPVKLRLHKGKSLEEVAEILQEKVGLKSKENFVFWAKILGYKQPAACAFTVQPQEDLWNLISNLKKQSNRFTNVTINGSAGAKQIARNLQNHLEVDSAAFMQFIQSSDMEKYGVSAPNWFCLMIPNTYNIKCSDGLPEFLNRMKQEYDKFWNQERKGKAQMQKLSAEQVINIASIVTKESIKYDEYENIAGVYINRYRKDMLLQADPTVNFARGFDGQPTKTDLQRDNPYNTYKYKGLPPGPICVPNAQAIDAVLNYGQHDYLFFCAKPEFDGHHNFAATYEAHLENVKLYREALKKRK